MSGNGLRAYGFHVDEWPEVAREVRPHPETYVRSILSLVEAALLSGLDPCVFAEAEVSDQFFVGVVDGVVGVVWFEERRDGGRASVVDGVGCVVAPARDGPCVGARDPGQGKVQRR